MQDREHHVHRGQDFRSEGKRCFGLTVDSRQSPVGDGQIIRTRIGAQPRAVSGDTDRDHLEALRIKMAQDAARRHTRNRMLGAAATVDDGDSDPGAVRTGSHKLERLQPGPADASVRVKRPPDVSHQIIGVLDTCRDPGETARYVITPAGAAIHRGMDPTETGRGHQ